MQRADLVRLARDLVPEDVEQARVIEIEGFDAQASRGARVAAAAEIGGLVITRTDDNGKFDRRHQIALT